MACQSMRSPMKPQDRYHTTIGVSVSTGNHVVSLIINISHNKIAEDITQINVNVSNTFALADIVASKIA